MSQSLKSAEPFGTASELEMFFLLHMIIGKGEILLGFLVFCFVFSDFCFVFNIKETPYSSKKQSHIDIFSYFCLPGKHSDLVF